MQQTIFYSWQSDLPNNINRSLIERAAEAAAKSIRADDSLGVDPVIERDTTGLPGSPNIAEAIFTRIESASIFLADVTIIGQINGARFTPNPNVLVELGYAIRVLGKERILLVMNAAKGDPTQLPFDLHMIRVIKYAADDSSTIAEARSQLTGQLKTAFEGILSSLHPSEDADVQKLNAALYSGQPGKVPLARQVAERLFHQLQENEPDYSHIAEGEYEDDILVASLEKTRAIVDIFANEVHEAVLCNDQDVLFALGRMFELLAEEYYTPLENGLPSSPKRGDYYKALFYELYLIYVSPTLLEKNYEQIEQLLKKELRVSKWGMHGQPAEIIFEDLMAGGSLFIERGKRLQRASAMADWLHGRRVEGVIGKTNIDWNILADSDLLLYLYCTSLSQRDVHTRYNWPPFTAIYQQYRIPAFIESAYREGNALNLTRFLGFTSIQELKDFFVSPIINLGRLFGGFFSSPLEDVQIDKIGSKK